MHSYGWYDPDAAETILALTDLIIGIDSQCNL